MLRLFPRTLCALILTAVLTAAVVISAATPGVAVAGPAPGNEDTPTIKPGVHGQSEQTGVLTDLVSPREEAFITRRTAGDNKIGIEQAGELRAKAADDAKQVKASATRPTTFSAPWSAIGPNPAREVLFSDGALTSVSGRIGALAIRQNGQFILGAALGGIWLYDSTTRTWTNRTDNLPSLATGALAVAPSNDLVVYDGTGDAAFSGAYFGNGILRSRDGGITWTHVSGEFFRGVSVSRLAIDPGDANHLYAAVRGALSFDGALPPPIHSSYGVWESKDGGVTWTLLKPAPALSLGATDLRLDPQNPKVLYASFYRDATPIYKSTDGGATWASIMNGLPADAHFANGRTMFPLGLSHPKGQSAVLYTGFAWTDSAGKGHASRVFKSTDEGATWTELPTGGATPDDSVLDYCSVQCSYDNVVEPDPTDPNVVFVGGQYGYNLNPQTGGLFRSDDGGQSWKNLGWDMHPDFHAIVFDPNDSHHVLIGNDGGVWYSTDRGGRLNASDPLSAADFQFGNLNGGGLQITQFISIATNPSLPARFWGGTQDNGTERKSATSDRWFAAAGGDGGQVLVDPTDFHYVYGEQFGLPPFRFTDGGGTFFSQVDISNGINTADRSAIYVPFVMNPLNPNQLFLGTYRLYRTDSAKAFATKDVTWVAISPDLTSGCPRRAPNGATSCTISAIGVGGGQAVYTGSLDGLVYLSTDAQVNMHPSWVRLGNSGENGNNDGAHRDVWLPQRPVSQFAVDRSNYRVAYIAYTGFSAATPKRPGHVFKTLDGGLSFRDISGNLPDSPVNTIVLDPAYPNTLYAGTDVGPFVTHDGGDTWSALGTGFPVVTIDHIDLDPGHRLIAAGTYGRGAWKLADGSAPAPALVISKADAGVPVGPGSNIDYSITLRNIGNGNATGVKIGDPVPDHTRFVSADNGGMRVGKTVRWTDLTVPAGGSITVHLRVRIDPSLDSSVTSIIDDGYTAESAEGPRTSGSPVITPFAPPFAVSISPATLTDGARAGQSVNQLITVQNLGYKTDSYNMSSSGGTFSKGLFDSTCTIPLTTTASLIAGALTSVCLKVDVPLSATNAQTSIATVTATSVASPTVTATATVNTIAVTVDTLLVDEDGNSPDVNSSYTAALTAAGVSFNTWDLDADANIPPHYMQAFKNIVWFTGNSYPGPITGYEPKLKAFLDHGGRLFMSGQDILDQGAGTTAFVRDYLHVSWDGSNTPNDVMTNNVNGVTGTLTDGVGTVPLDSTVLGNTFMDEITPNGTATGIFTDDATQTDGLSFSGSYKVVFLPFGFEEYGTAAQKADLVARVMAFFGP